MYSVLLLVKVILDHRHAQLLHDGASIYRLSVSHQGISHSIVGLGG